MKILITGKNSYIGNQIKSRMNKVPDYEVSLVSLRDDHWKTMDFSGYDAVIHLAGIVHKKEEEVPREQYFQVNRDLTEAVGKKARAEGVPRLIFFSTMAVYGQQGDLSRKVVITGDTKEAPNNDYGRSKLAGEEALKALENSEFKVAILRPPMIYGKGCQGNYARLRKLALKWPVYPNMHNQRSMLYIENLMELLKGILDQGLQGTFLPQDREYADTLGIIREIRKAHGKKTRILNLLKPLLFIIGKNSSTINKAFGSLCYEKSLSVVKAINYQKVGMKEGVQEIEK